MASIAIRGVRKAYAKNAVVHGVDLDIASREFIVILGPSGCGKSTLLRMVAGLEEISGGEIAIDGRVVNNLEPRERGCAMVFQNYALYPHMTVAENIGYALKVAGVPKDERRRRVEATAKIVGLEAYLDRRPAALSGGQRQRVAMGRAIVREPKVFLFDEPLSNLDAKLRVAMRAEIRRLHRRLGATSIFVTHDQVEAMTLGDRLVVMNGGRIEQVGSPAEVYNRPASRFVASFVGSPAMNLMEGTIDRHGVFVYDAERQIPIPATLDARLVGHKVALGVRAEAARLVEPGTAGSIPATVDFVEELGAGRVVHTDLDGLSFAVSLSTPNVMPAGTPVGIAIDPRDVHLFSIETGLRIEFAAGIAAPANSN
ncbi:sn-glycerol-3-phosphate ABC transporter ATP-binding protein UgpC [Kaistia dalseonensis]|uniref:Sn-glycerol 3-phosphate transport system ATP-binding protein n=1 Tax=Kaistia dalseonensis TaxID=410840 RepID=A0ABU0HDG3_9HYPH|nr:sn-glycerol-3-phosphate ABC transporter ATP-binding protein UgpC [Kaistia dalseonensis]MCX5497681.1 sn-glycerol-3-phosphate ABC transporter ATP-binding protein UgpC [Kaistia dalseonensis]MDQ0440325.1 sn-glycerol 3-phosphate transport system ATP-binding protein [Kaistia dalseonensis]